LVKTCRSCLLEKSVDEFYKNVKVAGGLQSYCKPCDNKLRLERDAKNPARAAARARKYRANNPEARKASKSKWYQGNKQKYKQSVDKYRAANRERLREADKKYRDEKSHEYNQRTANRRAKKLMATPKWANKFFMEEIYDLCKRRTKALGVSHHVDHIVPLNSKLVCGLHCEANLRVIPSFENHSKNNRYWPDMP
jgi:hypothetical protein